MARPVPGLLCLLGLAAVLALPAVAGAESRSPLLATKPWRCAILRRVDAIAL